MSEFRFDRKFAKNILLSATSAMGLQGIMALIVYPSLSRLLGIESFGHFMLALSITNFIIPVFVGAFGNSLMRRHKEIPVEQQPGFWLTGAISIGLIGVLLGASLTVGARSIAHYWNVPELAAWLPAMAPSMVGTMIYYNLRVQLVARAAFVRMVFCDACYGVGLLSVPLGVSAGIFGDWWPILFLIAPICGIVAILFHLLPQKALGFSGVDLATIKSILGPMSIYLFGLAAAWVMRMGDRWVLAGAGLDGRQIAYYSVAVQASFLFLFPMEHVSVVLMSAFSNTKSLDDIERVHLKRYFLALALSMVLLLIGGPLFGYLYIRFLFGVEYVRPAMPVLFVINISLVFFLFQMFSRGIIVRFRHPITDPIVSIVFAALSMGLIIFLTPRFGILGTAIGRGLGFAGVGIVFFIICQWGLLSRLLFSRDKSNGISSLHDGRSAVNQPID